MLLSHRTQSPLEHCQVQLCDFFLEIFHKLDMMSAQSLKELIPIEMGIQEKAKHPIYSRDFRTILGYVKLVFHHLMNIKEELEENIEQSNSNGCSNYEVCLQKLEAEVREHIRTEQQLKIYIESVQEQLDTMHKAKIHVEDKFKLFMKEGEEKSTLLSLESMRKDEKMFEVTQYLKVTQDKLEHQNQTIKQLNYQIQLFSAQQSSSCTASNNEHQQYNQNNKHYGNQLQSHRPLLQENQNHQNDMQSQSYRYKSQFNSSQSSHLHLKNATSLQTPIKDLSQIHHKQQSGSPVNSMNDETAAIGIATNFPTFQLSSSSLYSQQNISSIDQLSLTKHTRTESCYVNDRYLPKQDILQLYTNGIQQLGRNEYSYEAKNSDLHVQKSNTPNGQVIIPSLKGTRNRSHVDDVIDNKYFYNNETSLQGNQKQNVYSKFNDVSLEQRNQFHKQKGNENENVNYKNSYLVQQTSGNTGGDYKKQSNLPLSSMSVLKVQQQQPLLPVRSVISCAADVYKNEREFQINGDDSRQKASQFNQKEQESSGKNIKSKVMAIPQSKEILRNNTYNCTDMNNVDGLEFRPTYSFVENSQYQPVQNVVSQLKNNASTLTVQQLTRQQVVSVKSDVPRSVSMDGFSYQQTNNKGVLAQIQNILPYQKVNLPKQTSQAVQNVMRSYKNSNN